MQLTPANLNLFFTQLDTRFTLGIRNAARWSDPFVTTYPMETDTVAHGWMGMIENMRIWRGSRVVREPAPQIYQVPMLPWELTAAIDMFKVMTDKYGLYFPLAQRLGAKTGKLQDYAFRDLLQGKGELGAAPFSYGPDGVAFWSASHPVDYWDASKGTYANDYGTAGVSVGGITVGGYWSTTSYVTAWEDMASRLNESGEAIGVNPDRVLLPTQLIFPGRVVLQSMFFSPPQLGYMGSTTGANAAFVGNMDNPMRGSADITSTPDLNAQPTAWYLGDTSDVMKPLGWAVHTAPTYVVRNAPTDPSVFDQHRYLHGSWAYSTPHWGFPWQLTRSGV